MTGFGNQYLIFCMAMEEVVCTIQPMKLVTMDHETVSGCGVVDILFPSVAGTKVYGCQGISYSKQAQYLKFKWMQWDLNYLVLKQTPKH